MIISMIPTYQKEINKKQNKIWDIKDITENTAETQNGQK